MENKTFVELMCGRGVVTSVFNFMQWQTFSTDKRRRKGICEPDLQYDIMKIYRRCIPFKHINVVFAAPPCQVGSNGAGNFYFDGREPRENAKYFLSVWKRTFDFIEELAPDLYFIENPRGKFRYEKCTVDFLARTGGTIKEITLGSYGFPTIKPTDILTNAYNWKPLEKMAYGPGCKNPVADSLTDLPLTKRQETPLQLATEIERFCYDYFSIKSPVLI